MPYITLHEYTHLGSPYYHIIWWENPRVNGKFITKKGKLLDFFPTESEADFNTMRFAIQIIKKYFKNPQPKYVQGLDHGIACYEVGGKIEK